MKKFILGLVVGLILFVPLSVKAWSSRQIAKPIFGADCRGPFKENADGTEYILDRNSNKIPDPSADNATCSVTVYVFDDAGNKCYIVKGSNASGISCLKASQ